MSSDSRPRRLGWGLRSGLASQAFSSASNFLLVVAVARVGTPTAFGGFAIAYSIYLLVLGTVRGLIGETLSVQPRDMINSDGGLGTRSGLGAALIAGVVMGVPMAVVGLALPSGSPVGPSLVAFGLGMPVLLAQDSVRFIGFARGRSSWSAVSDGTWLSVQVGGTVLLTVLATPTAPQLVLLWSLAAGCGWLAVAGAIGSPALSHALPWLVRNRRTGVPFASEFLLGPGSSHAMLYIVGGFAGVVAAGALRAAQTIFGPLNTLLLGVQAVALPEASQNRASRGSRSLERFVARLSGSFMLCALGFGAIVLFIPDSLGATLFGETWSPAVPLLLPIALRFVAAAVARGYLLGLRAGGAIKRSLVVRAVTGLATVTFALVGVLIGGVVAAAYGLVLAHVLGLLLAMLSFRSRVRN